MRRLPDDFYELQITETRHTPRGELKPNPRVLLDIIEAVGASRDRCAYVGDSIFKDVSMARDVDVYDIHAKYGESQKIPEYALLQKVSHWSESDVQREREIASKEHSFTPSATLTDSFAEVFIYCDFQKFQDKPSLSASNKDNAIDIWKKCIDVQQHFNDLEMRIRNFAITIVGALIAAVSFTYQQGLQTKIAGFSVPSGLGLIVAALFAWGGFFLMDRYWYHILLKGAVKHASKIETQHKEKIPEIGLGSTISEASGGVKLLGFKMNSDRRLEAFYAIGAIMLILIFIVLLFAQTSRTFTPALTCQPAAVKQTTEIQSPTGQQTTVTP